MHEKEYEVRVDKDFDDEFISELDGIGETIGDLFERGPESIDVTARVLALHYVDFDAIIADIFDDENDDEDTGA